jgi:DNA-directed RNA polymerase specialized sigma24 family protein
MDETEAPQPEYAAWLERITATYQAVAYTCAHRLHDRELGKRVSAAVVARLVSRPNVFRYQGLPFSGRIATLAEALLADAREHRLPPGPEWSQLRTAFAQVPPELQEVFVLACVHGRDIDEIAADLNCDYDTARSRCDEAVRLIRNIGESAAPSVADTKR